MVDLTKKRNMSQLREKSPSSTAQAIVYDPSAAVGNRAGRVPLSQAIAQFQYSSIAGIYDYNDAGTTSSPISMPSSGTWYTLTNDGLGPLTVTDYGKAGIANVWDSSTNSFDWSGLEIGSRVDIRVDVTVTTTSSNQVVYIHLFNDDGGAAEYEIPMDAGSFHKFSDSHRIVVSQFFYIGNDETKNGFSRLKIKSDGAASVVVTGWAVGVMGS